MTARQDFEKFLHGQLHNVGASGSATQAAASAAVRTRVFTWAKPTDDALAATTSTSNVFYPGRAVTVTGVMWIPNGATANDAADIATLTVQKADGAGGAGTAIATLSTVTGGGAMAAGVKWPLTLTATVANRSVTATQILQFDIAKGGAGKIVTTGTLIVEYTED